MNTFNTSTYNAARDFTPTRLVRHFSYGVHLARPWMKLSDRLFNLSLVTKYAVLAGGAPLTRRMAEERAWAAE